VVCVPRTAVGEGDNRVGDGEAEAATLLDGVAGGGGDPDRAAEGAGDGVDGDVLGVTVGDEATALAEGLELASVDAGRSATLPVDDAANTTAPSPTRPASRAIGTTRTRLPRGRGSRQLGQKPETGVVT
jgi:hypothetical protein